MSTNDESTPAVTPSVDIYTDGGCKPNPGLGGSNLISRDNLHPACDHLLPLPRAKDNGVVLLHPKKRAEAGGGFRLTST